MVGSTIGLYYNGARYLAAWLGRWTSADPIGMQAGVNLYQYCRGSPINYTDPTGTEEEATGSTASEVISRLRQHAYGPAPRFDPDRLTREFLANPGGPSRERIARSTPPGATTAAAVMRGTRVAEIFLGAALKVPVSGVTGAIDAFRKDAWGTTKAAVNPANWLRGYLASGDAMARAVAASQYGSLEQKAARLGEGLAHGVGVVSMVAPIPKVPAMLAAISRVGSATLRAVESGLPALRGFGVRSAVASTGGFIGAMGEAGATGPAKIVRPLVAADLGVPESAVVKGTFSLKAGKATAKIDYLGAADDGLGRSLLDARKSLNEVAKAEGASSLRIETSPIIEETGRLRGILLKKGFQERSNATMYWEGKVK